MPRCRDAPICGRAVAKDDGAVMTRAGGYTASKDRQNPAEHLRKFLNNIYEYK